MTVDEMFALFPTGTVLPFAGDPATVPGGWQICDGSNGTVNLVGRIAIGTNQLAAVGTLAGSDTHTHGFTQGQQTDAESERGHPIDPNGGGDGVAIGGHHHRLSNMSTDPGSSLPPVTYVIFIQRV